MGLFRRSWQNLEMWCFRMRELRVLPGATAVCEGTHCDFTHGSCDVWGQQCHSITKEEGKQGSEWGEKKWQKHMKKKEQRDVKSKLQWRRGRASMLYLRSPCCSSGKWDLRCMSRVTSPFSCTRKWEIYLLHQKSWIKYVPWALGFGYTRTAKEGGIKA